MKKKPVKKIPLRRGRSIPKAKPIPRKPEKVVKKRPTRQTKPVKKKVKVKKRPTKIKKKVYTPKFSPNDWITITFRRSPAKAFFPSNIFPEYLKGGRMLYETAKRLPLSYWNDKKVIFHMADKDRLKWLPFYKNIINNAKICWVKFVAGVFMTDMTQLDIRRYAPTLLSFYQIIDNPCQNILWELSPHFKAFWKSHNYVNLTLYDKKYEEPVRKKTIDFLMVIDDRLPYNYIKNIKLIQLLAKHGYKCHLILVKWGHISPKYVALKQKNLAITHNTKDSNGQKTFYDLLKQSKIMIDLSFRWTYGRVVYEALFQGAISICPYTYGASYHLFPDLMVDTSNYDMQEVYKKCVDVVKNWSPKVVEQYRRRARNNASPQVFANNLNKETARILEQNVQT